MIIRLDIAVLVEVPDDGDAFEYGVRWAKGNMPLTSAKDWTCVEMFDDDYLP